MRTLKRMSLKPRQLKRSRGIMSRLLRKKKLILRKMTRTLKRMSMKPRHMKRSRERKQRMKNPRLTKAKAQMLSLRRHLPRLWKHLKKIRELPRRLCGAG